MPSISRRNAALLATFIIGVSLVLSACPKRGAQVEEGASTTTTTNTTVDKDRDQDTASASVLAAQDLPGSGWKRSTTATTEPKSKNNKNIGSSFDCPELDAEIGSGFTEKSVTAESPVLERSRPTVAEVRNSVALVPTDEEASVVLEAAKREQFRACLERGLRHDNAKEDRNAEVTVYDWKLSKVGDTRVGFEVNLVFDNDGKQFEAFVGIAIVKVGRAVSTTAVTFTEPLGDEARQVIEASVQKIRDNQ